MNEVRKVILPIEIKKQLLEKHNKACNTYYQIKDISYILEYLDKNRKIILYEMVFNDYINQRFFKDSLEIDNLFQ